MPQSGRPSLLETRREVRIWTKSRKWKTVREGGPLGKKREEKPAAPGGGYCGHRGPRGFMRGGTTAERSAPAGAMSKQRWEEWANSKSYPRRRSRRRFPRAWQYPPRRDAVAGFNHDMTLSRSPLYYAYCRVRRGLQAALLCEGL